MKLTHSVMLAAATIAAGFLLSGCAGLPKPPTDVDPAAVPVLKRLSSTLSGASSFSYTGHREVDTPLNPEGNIKSRAAISGTVQHPDRFSGRVSDSVSTRAITYDGRKLTVFDTNGTVYATVGAKPTLDQTLDVLIRDWAVKPPMAPFLRSDFYGAVTNVGGSWKSLGGVKVRGMMCDHLRLTIPTGTADLMVARSDGLPRELTITYTAIEGSPRVRVTDLNWKLNVKTSPDQFRAKIPAGATEVEMIPAR